MQRQDVSKYFAYLHLSLVSLVLSIIITLPTLLTV